MGNENYSERNSIEETEMDIYESTLDKFPFLKRTSDAKDLTTIYIDPKKVFSRKERKDIEFAIKFVSEQRLHAF
jgi:hypothetical protein